MAIRADLGGGLESQQWIVNAYLLTLGPPVSAGGVLYLIATVDESPGLLLEVLPGTTIFAVGLAIVVAPLTETVLSDADEHDAGIASGVNNAVARVAGLLATAAVGTVAGGNLDLGGFRMALAVAAGLLALGGTVALAVSGAIVRSSVAGVSRALW